MTATLDKIKSFMASPVSYTLIREYDFFRSNYHNPSLADAQPMTEGYYHPLNPCFLFELAGPAIMRHSPIITVRDGFITFMDFLLNNHQALSRWNTLFIVPQSYERLIPYHLSSHFLGYQLSQKTHKKTNSKFIFGYLTEEYLGSDIEKTLSKIKLDPEDKVTLYLSQETNLEKVSYNNIFAQEFLFKLADKLKSHEVRHINTSDFLNTSDFSQYELIDLASSHGMVFDNFVHFLMASRGCQSVYPQKTSNALMSIDLSMFHQLDLYELTPHNECFSELLLYKKQNPAKRLIEDPYFSSFLKHFMNTRPHKA